MENPHLPQGVPADSISLMLGHPDPATLLTPAFQQAAQRVLAGPQALAALQYGPEPGAPALIDFLTARFRREHGVPLDRRQLMIVAGSTHAVDMIARLLAGPGAVVLVEAPTYVDALHIFRDHRVELRGVPVDDHGLRTDALADVLRQLEAEGRAPSLLYTIPNFHNPAGVTLSAARRADVLRLAQQYGFWIVEDDVYRDLSFDAPALNSFFALAGGAGVLSIGSFSKTLAPGLRLGWLAGPAETIARFVNCGTTQMGGGANPFAAQIVAEYCQQGHWETHIQELRMRYRQRRDVMLAALEAHMPAEVRWTRPGGGFFLWLTLPEGLTGRAIKQAAQARGVLLSAGEGFFVHPADGARHVRLTYSFAPPEAIERAIPILAEVIREGLSA
jgi:2-aminoadipate transaminase